MNRVKFAQHRCLLPILFIAGKTTLIHLNTESGNRENFPREMGMGIDMFLFRKSYKRCDKSNALSEEVGEKKQRNADIFFFPSRCAVTRTYVRTHRQKVMRIFFETLSKGE